jgi:hypothetical protein
MSGRDKHAPTDAREELEQRRQLARELNEATKDARRAAAELRAAHAETLNSVAEIINAAYLEVADRMRVCRESLEHFEGVVTQRTDSAVKAIEDNHARLCGFKDSTEFSRWIVTEVVEALLGTPQFIRDVGMIAARATSPEIMVTTADALSSFIAGGGDPGIVIDGR